MLKKIIEARSTTARTTTRRSAFPSDHRPRQADSEERSRAQARSMAEQPRPPLCDHTDANRRKGASNTGRIASPAPSGDSAGRPDGDPNGG